MLKPHNTRENVVLFLHIPKAAGTTMRNIVDRQYRPGEVYQVLLAHPNFFAQMPPEQRASYRAVQGHILYGFHELVPHPTTYITLLRDPVERIISQYYYIRRQRKTRPPFDQVNSRNMSLHEYVCSNMASALENEQTRLLAGQSGVYEINDTLERPTRADLEKARHNLQHHFAVVGIQERFDDTLLLLHQALGWNKLWYRRQNVTHNRPLRDDCPPETLERIKQMNMLDIELYTEMRARFDEIVRQQGLQMRIRKRMFHVISPVMVGVDAARHPKRIPAVKKTRRWLKQALLRATTRSVR